MSRTKRFLNGVALTYTNQIIVMVVGLWLTPFLLHHLGQNDFGLWLIGLKVLSYLALLDIGVLGLLPREVAFAKGRIARGESPIILRTLIEETIVVILSQVPLLVIAAVIAWRTLPIHGATIRSAVLLILVVFVVQFPLRVIYAALEGLQELGFLGGLQIVGWAFGLLVNVGLIVAGRGLYGLAVGWAVTQAILMLGAIWHFYRRYPEFTPKRLPRLSFADYKRHLGAGLWVSIGQIATLLRTSDLLLVGRFLGPSAVVPFSCTQKLTAIGSNQPLVIMQTAQPALSELRAQGDRKHLASVVGSLTQAMLVLSGAVTVVILAINHAFVTTWVGNSQYLGFAVTLAMLIEMMLRHWNVTTVYSLFSFGHQRHISTVSVIEGALSTLFSAGLILLMGPIGAVLGSIVAVLGVSLPWNLWKLSRELECSVLDLLTPLSGWAMRFVPVLGVVAIVGETLQPHNYPAIAGIALAAIALYSALQWSIVRHSRWLGHIQQHVEPLRKRFLRRAPVAV